MTSGEVFYNCAAKKRKRQEVVAEKLPISAKFLGFASRFALKIPGGAEMLTPGRGLGFMWIDYDRFAIKTENRPLSFVFCVSFADRL